MAEDMKLIHGDMLKEHEQIESGSVDLILTDLPYGIMNGYYQEDYITWDNAISPKEVFEIANRILRVNGRLVLFAQEPYTSQLASNAISNLPLSYKAYWVKNSAGNAAMSERAMVSVVEEVLVFSKQHDHEALHPLRAYFKEVLQYIGTTLGTINKTLGHRRAEHAFYINGTQFALCTKETYVELTEVFDIDAMDGFKPYSELEKVDKKYKKQVASTFNLWEGGKQKKNTLKYRRDYDGYHPTQKPVLLLEDLIKTFSNKGDLVADLTMGSGSTGVACKNTGRRFIGIELDEEYFKIATERIETHEKQLSLV